jgi:uncharacterized protein (TIGR02145 family)
MKTMKKAIITFALFVFGFTNAQVKIGNNPTAINPSSVLELESTTQGFLPPRLTYAQKTAIASPAAGLQVWCTDCGIHGETQVYNGFSWTHISGANASDRICGAYVSAGVFKEFSCYNLGATDTSLDPHVPVQAIHGNYYQWGRSSAAATTDAIIGTWNTSAAANGSWLDASKTGNDPCPTGYRVPTKTQWEGVLANNTSSNTGSWANDGNFTTAVHFGPNGSTHTLTLPIAGYRSYTNGALNRRGNRGYYWSSTESGVLAYALGFVSTIPAYADANYRTTGFSVRCVSE